MYVQAQNVSNVSSVVFNTGINSLNSYYQLVFDSAVVPSSSTMAYITIQVSDDLGATFKNTNYINNLVGGITSGMIMGIVNDSVNSNHYTVDGGFYINNLYFGTGLPSVSGTANSYATTGSGAIISGQIISGIYQGPSLVVNALRVISSDGNNISGNFYLYAF